MLPRQTQQVPPAFVMAETHSQQAWIMAAQALSPLVQVSVTPSPVISHLHRPITRLQQQTIIPFIITQQVHMPPASIVQRFCTMPEATLSSLVQEMVMPPVHFSTFTSQRGTIIMFMPAGIVPGVPIVPAPMPAGPITPATPIIPLRSIIIALLIGLGPRS
jgi:hypothetical protein